MGVVVLDFFHGKRLAALGGAAAFLFGPLRRKVFGVRVDGKQFGLRLEQLFEVGFRRKPCVEHVGVFHVAYVLAYEGLGAAQQTEGVLLLGAACEDGLLIGGAFAFDRYGHGRIAARAAHHLNGIACRARSYHAHDGVVETAANGAVIAQECIGDACKAVSRFGIFHADGLVVQIARRHNEGSAEGGEQQMLHGGVGQHNAELAQMIGEPFGKRRLAALLQQHDRALRPFKQAGLGIAYGANFANFIYRAIHNGEGLAFPMLAGAQRGQSFLVACVAGQMETAKPFYGHDAAFAKHGCGAFDNRVARLQRASPQHALVVCLRTGKRRRRAGFKTRLPPGNMRPAFEAGVGLRVKAPIGRVAIFRLAAIAHGEAFHRRFRSVVGQAVYDGESRPAIRAVDKRVVEAAVFGIEQLCRAFVARGQIGRNKRGMRGFGLFGIANLEILEALKLAFPHADLAYAGGGRRMVVDFHYQRIDVLAFAFGMDEYPCRAVEHPSANASRNGGVVDEGPKADALHHAVDFYVERFNHSCS